MPMPKNFLKAHTALMKAAPTQKRATIRNEDGSTRINIYDEIGPWGVNASDFIAEFGAWDTGSGPVNVHINSPGGDVYDGLAIYHSLKHSDAEIIVHIDGLAASAASFIAMAGDRIVMGRNSRMMIHDASTIVYGNAQDMRETAEWLDEESDNIADIYAQRAGGNATEWRTTMQGEQWYSAEQAKEAGLADEIEGAAVEDKTSSVAASLFQNTPDGTAQPERTTGSGNLPDFGTIAAVLRGAF
jgi:ATP-dependent Clp endopeptidase proteolytic subunit ClpP